MEKTENDIDLEFDEKIMRIALLEVFYKLKTIFLF